MLLEGKNKSIGGRPTMKASKVLGWKTKIIKAASQGSKCIKCETNRPAIRYITFTSRDLWCGF